MNMQSLVVGSLLAVLLLLAPGLAVAKTIQDREGDGGALDLAEIRARHHDRGAREWWTFTLETHDSFGNSKLQKFGSRGHCPLSVRLRVESGDSSDVKVCIYATAQGSGYRLHATVNTGGGRWNDTGRKIGEGRVWRVDARTIKLEVDEKEIAERNVSAIGWGARAVSSNAEDATVFDFVPGRKRLVRENS